VPSRLAWTPSATRDVDEYLGYVAVDDPAAAERLALHLREAAQRLLAFPGLGRPGRVGKTRELVVPGTPAILAYRVHADRVEVLRVLHAKQQWPWFM
jgi:toxin ParE1/3/4